MKSSAYLAHKIERGIETPSGRYDWASKVEVKAYVDRKDLEGLNALRAEFWQAMAPLQSRIAELELSWWQRLKRRLVA